MAQQPGKKHNQKQSTSSGWDIFVVDDEPDVLEVIAALLEVKGHQARVFTDPFEALSEFEKAEAKPRLLISDYQMPKMNGMELLQRCRGSLSELRCISASGTLQFQDLEQYSEKPDLFLSKPFRSGQLWDAVDEMLAD